MKSKKTLLITTLGASAVSLGVSVGLYFANNASETDRLNGIFVGVWVPSILALGSFVINASSSGSKK